MKIIGVIPARLGSKRVKAKNLRLLDGKPLIYYIVETAKKSKKISEVYINSEDIRMEEIARRYGVKFYHRPKELAKDNSMIDEYIYNFIKNVECDIVAVINPTSPFLTVEEIDDAINSFIDNGFDTQLACTEIRTHCFYREKPINFSTSGQHPRSQDLEPVLGLNFAITIWKTKTFAESFERNGFGVYSGKIGFYSFHGLSTIDIDWEEDFILAEAVMKHLKSNVGEVTYDKILD